jgi:cell division protein FtsX
MENIIHFFRDILDGPLYVIVVIISILLLCVCIGYLIDVRQKRQHIYKEQEINSNQDAVALNTNSEVKSVYSGEDNTDSNDII